MNFDCFYSEKKPTRPSEKEKEKILDLLFKIKSNPDQKLLFYIDSKKNLIFKNYINYIKHFYIKNRVLYVEIDSNLVFQEIQFLLPEINKILELDGNLLIKKIKRIKKK